LFAEAVEVQTDFNALLQALRVDPNFILNVLQETTQNDPFTAKLVDIYRVYFLESRKQALSMGVLRSDYMVSQSGRRPTLRQVEINTIASSFGFLSERVCRAHRMLALKFPQLRIQLEDMPRKY